MTSDLLFSIAAWIFVIFMACAAVAMLLAFLAAGIACFLRGAWFIGVPVLVLWVFFVLAMTASIIRIGEQGGSYTDVWTLLRA